VSITGPVRGQRQHFRTESGNGMAPGAAGRVQEETMDDVQPERVAGRIRALRAIRGE
jgi:hypothetical protein